MFHMLIKIVARFHMTIVPEDGIVAISDGNSEDDLIPLQRALPPPTEESMAVALEPPPSSNSMLPLVFST